MQGWAKFKREWFENPVVRKDNDYLAVMVYICVNALFEKREELFGKDKITLDKGQLLTTHKEMYKELGIERNKLDRIIKALKSEELIKEQTNRHKTIITLLFADEYQGANEEQGEEQISIKRATKQDRENEKEKSSKREKDKEKEKIKNVKNTNYYVKGCRNNLSYANECVENCQGVDFEKQLEIYDNGALNKESEQSPVAYDSCDSLVFKHYIKNTNQDEIDAMFERLWQAYPKKVGKRYARECFKRLKPTEALLDKMLLAIEKQRKSEAWKRDKGQYIPNPSTWLNQGRWEDELEVSTHKLFENVDFGIEV